MHCTGAGHSGVEWEWGTAIHCNTLKTGLGAGNRAPARHVWITINGKRHRQEYVTTRKRAMRPGIYNEKQHKQLDFELRQLGLTPPSPGAILDTCSWVHLSFFLPRWTYDNFRERNASTVHFLTNSSRMHFVALCHVPAISTPAFCSISICRTWRPAKPRTGICYYIWIFRTNSEIIV